MITFLRSKSAQIIFAALFTFFGLLVFYDLGKAPLENWDEAFYGEAIKQMIRTKEFIIPSFNQAYFLEKPPLQMWMSVSVSAFTGLNEFVIRFPSALAGLLIVTITTYYAYRQFGFVPALFSFSTLALNNIFIWRSRTGNLDVLPTLFILLIFILLQSTHKYRYPLIGLLLGFVYLTKLSLVIIPLLITVGYEALFNRHHLHKSIREYGKLAMCFIALPAGWLVLGYMKTGFPFLEAYLYNADQGAGKYSVSNLSMDYINFAYYALQRRFFWVVLLGLGLLCATVKAKRNFLILLFSLLLFTQLLFFERKNNWYLVPMFPFWSLASGYAVYVVLTALKREWRAYIAMSIILSMICIVLSYRTFITNIIPLIQSQSTIVEARSAQILKERTQPSDLIARLDSSYPTLIYYSDRKVLSAPDFYTGGISKLFISRRQLVEEIQVGRIRWVVGKANDMEGFMKNFSENSYTIEKHNDEIIFYSSSPEGSAF